MMTMQVSGQGVTALCSYKYFTHARTKCVLTARNMYGSLGDFQWNRPSF